MSDLIEIVEIPPASQSAQGKKQIKSCPNGMKYLVKIEDELEEPSDWSEEIDLFKEAQPEDIIYVSINSPGGNYYTAIALIHAMRECRATIIGEITGCAYSAAGAIFLSCDEFKLHEFSEMMIHNSQLSGVNGSQTKVYESMEFSNKQSKRFIRSCYEFFLTEDEIDQVIHDKDLYLDVDEIADRLENLLDERERVIEEYKKKQERGFMNG